MVQDCPWFHELPAYIRLVGGASLVGKFWSCKDIHRRDNETVRPTAAANTLVQGQASIAINWEGGRYL